MIKRIFIIGDSFCDGIFHPKENSYYSIKNGIPGIKEEDAHWINHVDWYYRDSEIILDAFGSRDHQSMIDYWIKLFPILTENDRVIIGLPDTQRQRIPIQDEKDYREIEWSGGICKNMFLTRQWWHAYQDFKTTEASNFTDKNGNKHSEEWFDEIIFFLEIMNQSHTTAKNYKEVIESLYKVAPCKTYLFSWHDWVEYPAPKADCIEDKSDLTKNLGMWTTQDMMWKETNGKKGNKDDHHWDVRTMWAFGKYVIEKIK